MGSESIVYEAEDRMGYWLRGHEGERNNCFSAIQVVGQKISRLNIFPKLKLDFNPFLSLKHHRYGGHFGGYRHFKSIMIKLPELVVS